MAVVFTFITGFGFYLLVTVYSLIIFNVTHLLRFIFAFRYFDVIEVKGLKMNTGLTKAKVMFGSFTTDRVEQNCKWPHGM